MASCKFRLAAFADEANPALDKQIEIMQQLDIGLLEIRGVNGYNSVDLSDEKVREVRQKLDGGGISVWSIGSPIGKVQITQDAQIEQDRFKRVLEIAYGLGARCIRLFSFFGTEGKEEYRDEVLERLSRFAQSAKGSGVTLCHENEKGIYGDTPERCLEIHKSIPEIKAVFDPANFVQCHVDVLKAWEMLEPYVYYGHIKDCKKSGEVVPAGDGDGELRNYLPRLLSKGDRVLTMEPHLAEFVGLSGLETPGEKSQVGGMHFATNEDAFRYAVKALRSLVASLDGPFAEVKES